MKLITKMNKLLVVLLIVVAQPAWAVFEWTPFKAVGRIQSNVNTGTIIITQPARWGASRCPAAPYVQVLRGNNDFSKEILAHVMSAKVSETPVRFYGECVGGSYFRAIAVDW